MLHRISILLLCALLTSCMSPVTVTPDTTYELKTVPAVKSYPTHALTLMVTPPDAISLYDTAQMAYTNKPYEIAYFAKNRWATTPADMLNHLLIQTLQNTHYYRSVVSSNFIGHSDYVLNTQILQLKQDFLQKPSVVRVKIRAQLISANTHKIVRTQEFQATETAAQNTPYSGVIAANQAVARILKSIARFATVR